MTSRVTGNERAWITLFVWHTRITKTAGNRLSRLFARVGGVTAGPALLHLGKMLPSLPLIEHRNPAPPQPIPRIIWMFWNDGEAAAPDVAKYCFSSWRKRNPGWEVRVLDSETAADYVDLSYLPRDVRIQLFADALRLELLARYGGVWADASCLCTGSLDDWLADKCNGGFFAFERPGPDRPLANWFLVASPGNPLVRAWTRASRIYWENGLISNHLGSGGRRDQFIYHYLFEWMTCTDSWLKSLWAEADRTPAVPHFRLKNLLTRPNTLGNKKNIAEVLSGDLKMHKLNWRLTDAVETLNSVRVELP